MSSCVPFDDGCMYHSNPASSTLPGLGVPVMSAGAVVVVGATVVVGGTAVVGVGVRSIACSVPPVHAPDASANATTIPRSRPRHHRGVDRPGIRVNCRL
jgi:hypothetical protein